MRLIIQIPCWNEELMIGSTIRSVPRELPGVDEVQVLVIDDGSTDRTVEEAQAAGADHVVRLAGHQGLSAAFRVGLDRAASLGADVVVHMDADGQHPPEHIPHLIAPILQGKADLVVGVRPIAEVSEYSWIKRKLQLWGSWVVRWVSGTDIADTTCGFRAYSREAALRLTVLTPYTYTLETLIQAGRTNLVTTQVPVTVNPQSRPSRVVRSIPQYVFRQLVTIARIYVLYAPLRFFIGVAGLLLLLAGALAVRYLCLLYLVTMRPGHVQSLLLAGALLGAAFVVAMAGILADLLGANRKLLHEIVYRLRKSALSPEGWDTARPNRPPGSHQPGEAARPTPGNPTHEA